MIDPTTIDALIVRLREAEGWVVGNDNLFAESANTIESLIAGFNFAAPDEDAP